MAGDRRPPVRASWTPRCPASTGPIRSRRRSPRCSTAFIRFSADRPELDRIINLEATAPSARLDWLVATHLAPAWPWWARRGTSCGRPGGGADLTSGEVWELITSYGAMHFANAPMLAQLGIHGGDGRTEADGPRGAAAGRAAARLPPDRSLPRHRPVGVPSGRRYRGTGGRARRSAGRERHHGRPHPVRRTCR